MPEMKPPKIGDQKPQTLVAHDISLVDQDRKTEKIISYKEVVGNLENFDTEGWDEYPVEKFRKYVNENSINVGISLEEYLSDIAKTQDNFSATELSFISAFRVWLQCDHESAIKYTEEKFDFKCQSNEEFIKKCKFFNVVAFLISENKHNEGESLEINNEIDVFKKLKESISKNKGSFLLNYLAKDYERVIDGNKFSIQDGQDLDYAPFKLAPDVYGFDERSFFAMLSKHDLPRETFFVSEPKDKFEIDNILLNPNSYQKKLISQEAFEKLTTYFKPLNIEDISFSSMRKDESSMDTVLFRKLHEKYHRQNIYQVTGVDISEIPLKEQNSFVNYLKFVDSKMVEKIKGFANKFHTNGFRTFLSIEQGGKEMGDKILDLSEKLPEDVVKKLFAKYSEIIDKIDNLVGALEEKLKDSQKISTDSEIAVKDNLLIRAKNLLKKYTDNPDKNPASILRELEGVNSENVLLLSIFQSLHGTDGIKFEDIKDFSFINQWSGSEYLEQKEITDIENMIDKNYKDAPKSVRNAVKESFLSSVHSFHGYNSDLDVPRLKFKGKVVAACRMDYSVYSHSPDYGKKVYFGSFNVDPDFANGEIGNAMLERTVDKVATNHIVEADCNAFSKIGAKYIESGFNATDFYDFHGWPSFKIFRDDKQKRNIIGKNMTQEEIISLSVSGLTEKEGKSIQIISVTKPEDLTSAFQNIKAENKIVSRYFYNDASKKWYVVIEPNLSLGESL